MNERESLIQNEEKSFVFSSLYKVLLVLIVIFFALFIGKILFGTRSLEVLLDLNKQEKRLKHDIKIQQKENEKLQKELFEYQLAVPDSLDTSEN